MSGGEGAMLTIVMVPVSMLGLLLVVYVCVKIQGVWLWWRRRKYLRVFTGNGDSK
jgi:uncharacterized iron-regulated membrane protein